MTRATLLCSGLLLVTLPALHPAGKSDQRPVDLAASIDSFVQRRVVADSFSGVVMVARNRVPIYQRAAGFADREGSAAMTTNTRLQVASTTKLFTQIAVRQLEQAGKLSLTDTVGKFLPDYPNSVVRRKVTVEQLLRHRSGVGSFWNEKFMATRANVRSVQDYLELFQNDSLLFEPGTSEAYSNGGYVLLGAIIERVSGKSYQEYVQDRIFRPAGMTETVPYDSRVSRTNAAVGYTTQTLDGPMTGDRRLAGVGARPGYKPPVARRARSGGIRRPNTSLQAGVSSPAGDHYSTVGDFLKLANALVSHRLLDSTRTAAVLGARYAAGSDFRANGGGPGVNAEFSIYPSRDVLVVFSNYDPPAATAIAQYVRSLLASNSAPASIRTEVDSLHSAMMAAFKRSPPGVAQFYTDDARIIGMGTHRSGRAEVQQYWSQGLGATDWLLEVVEVGGARDAPWVLGRSVVVGNGGRRMITDYLAILARGTDGRLRYRIDLFTPSEPRPMGPRPPP